MGQYQKLKDLCEIKKGKKVKIVDKPSSSSVPYLLIDTLRGHNPKLFSEDEKYTEAIETDLLMVFDGANSGLVGTGLKGAVGSTIGRIRTNENLNNKYLTYFFNMNFSFLNKDTKGSAIPHIKPNKMLEMMIRLPEIEEQNLIVQAIETQFTRLDAAVKSLNSAGKKLAIYRNSVLKAAFNGELIKLQGGLVDRTLSEEFEIIMGQSPKSKYYNKSGEGLPFFQGKKEFSKLYPKVETWSTEASKIAGKGDVLLSIRAPIGPVNIAPSKCGIGRGLAAIKSNEKTRSKLIFYLLQILKNELKKRGTGTTFKAITKPNLYSLSIRLPKIKEDRDLLLKKIEFHFSVIDKIKQTVDSALLKSEQLRKSILKSAFEGRLPKYEGGSHD